MLAGSAIGVPGPVATMRPPCTCRSFDGGGGQIEADVGPFLSLLGRDQDAVANDDQAFRVIRHTR